jgi:hypothetical protein
MIYLMNKSLLSAHQKLHVPIVHVKAKKISLLANQCQDNSTAPGRISETYRKYSIVVGLIDFLLRPTKNISALGLTDVD